MIHIRIVSSYFLNIQIMAINVTYASFLESKVDAMSVESRIKELIEMLESENDYILIEDDNKQCYNEEELRKALREKGIYE